ncbi:hypothetical protein D9611_003600 [Ephemerocybe angulata]|uniref:Peptidase A1 domain-containing protein n=1 Tax=Ephemerocybe angulata TaxID=980116 RepID=A0A8H5B5D7_9AGAR|nr:hypothetical protein D9611_003600 [Tulosesus angulatus]
MPFCWKSSTRGAFLALLLLDGMRASAQVDDTTPSIFSGSIIAAGNNEIKYTTSLTINGKSFTVLVDPAGQDLWIKPGRIDDLDVTGIPTAIQYKLYDGGEYVGGEVAFAEVTLGNMTVKQQPLLKAYSNPITWINQSSSIDGVLGLGYRSPGSPTIVSALGNYVSDSKPETSGADTLLDNIFKQDPDVSKNFIAIDLARGPNLEEDQGSLVLGVRAHNDSVNATYIEGIENESVPVPVYTEGTGEWTVLVEEIQINGNEVPLTSVFKTSWRGTVVALLNAAAPRSVVSEAVRDSIYSQWEGGAQLKTIGGDPGRWHIPCTQPATATVKIGGQRYPIHPIDLTEITQTEIDGKLYSRCLSGIAAAAPEQFKDKKYEIVLGADFLRNVYTMYNYGESYIPPSDNSTLALPYMKFFAKTDPVQATEEHARVRTANLSKFPPEYLPKSVGGDTTEGTKDPATNSAKFLGSSLKNTKKPASSGTKNVNLEASPASGADSLSADDSTQDGLAKYGVAGLVLLGANLLIGIAVLAVAVLIYVKGKARKGGAAYDQPTRYVPVTTKGYSDDV